MPAPTNAHLTPPPNTWEGGQLKMPQSVLDILAARQGGAPMQGGQMGGGGPQGAPSNWAQYGMQNPDVMAEWQRLGANPKNPFGSADEYFKWHYGKFGKGEGRPGAPGADSQPFVDQLAQKGGGGGSPMLPGLLGLLLQNPGKTTGIGALGGGLLGQLFK